MLFLDPCKFETGLKFGFNSVLYLYVFCIIYAQNKEECILIRIGKKSWGSYVTRLHFRSLWWSRGASAAWNLLGPCQSNWTKSMLRWRQTCCWDTLLRICQAGTYSQKLVIPTYFQDKFLLNKFGFFFQEQLDVRVARIFNTFGPRMHFNDGRVVSNFILQALQNQPITVGQFYDLYAKYFIRCRHPTF